MRARWTGAFQIAAVYVGTVVGAGFATGREIAEFFTKYGFLGFLGILIAGYIFIYTGSKMMIYRHVLKHGRMKNLIVFYLGEN